MAHGIDGKILPDEGWFAKNFGPVRYLDPLQDPVAAAKQRMEIALDRERRLKERFPDLPIGNLDPEPSPPSSILWYDAMFQLCVIHGAPRPTWDPTRCIWWHSRAEPAFAWVKTVQDVQSIPIPRWQDEPEVQAMFKQREVMERAFPGRKIFLWQPWSVMGFTFMHYPNFIDLGPILLGSLRFFEMLIAERELAHALMEKIFEISVSYAHFMLDADGVSIEDIDGLTDLGGDHSAILSPRLFAEYGTTWNRMALDRFRKIANRSENPACNIHSCGPSTHLYKEFSQVPNVKIIETRGVLEGIEKLREALPDTHLHITLAPPQVNWGSLSPREIKSIMGRFTEGAGFRDSLFVAICPTETPDENVRAFYQALQATTNFVEPS